MELIKIRLTTFSDGAEIQTVWSVTPLRLSRSLPQARESTNDGEGRMRRRPMNIRDAFAMKLPAGLLLSDEQYQNFLRCLMAHKIEFQKPIAGTLQYVEYDLDSASAPSYLEDVDRLRSYTLNFVQSDATWYTDFESVIDNFENS